MATGPPESPCVPEAHSEPALYVSTCILLANVHILLDFIKDKIESIQSLPL